MIMLLSVSMAALSCSNTIEEEDKTYTVVISGTASDKVTSEPLRGIKINLYAAEEGNGEIHNINTRTDETGSFMLSAGGFTRQISCTITADDENRIYSFAQQDLKISWSGPTFDVYTNYFYVNDCDFYMEKMLKQAD
jgi:hypothetical protein